MVVKYIKIIVTTLTLVLVGLITTINLKADIDGVRDHIFLETEQLGDTEYYIVLTNGYDSDNTAEDWYNYLVYYGKSKVRIYLPTHTSIYSYHDNSTGLLSNANITVIEFVKSGSNLYLRLYDYKGEQIRNYQALENGVWSETGFIRVGTKILTTISSYSSLASSVGYTEQDLEEAFDEGKAVGIDEVYELGFEYVYNPFTSQYYVEENSYSYNYGYNIGHGEGYDDGYADGRYDYGYYDYGYYDPLNEGWLSAETWGTFQRQLGEADGYAQGAYETYYNGFSGIVNPFTNDYYVEEDSYSYVNGVNDHNDFSFTGLLFQVFTGIGSVLTIELLPNITLGAIVAVPIVFGIIYFILGKRKGD